MHVKQSHQRLPLNGRERTFGQRIGNCFVVRTHEMEFKVVQRQKTEAEHSQNHRQSASARGGARQAGE